MSELPPCSIGDRRQQLPDRAAAREPRREARLEARAGRNRAEGRANDRRGVDQGRQLRPVGLAAAGQQSIDGLIQAFGRCPGWQGGLLDGCVEQSP
jgi:hypothetical protein